ncbi:MAG: DUF3533 domain-containing protein [Solirubrobacterales bacterium]|nr:DUF3533 domain-containing protein [Solirubrobacterales bacterium]OJU95771.1 MAG: hypothetical protein BGO23_09270 [Solirubrobacterales bacterium 67-14]
MKKPANEIIDPSLRPDRRTLLLSAGAILGVAALALLFIASYGGALHQPKPHGVPVSVARGVPPKVIAGLEAGGSLDLTMVDDRAAALDRINKRGSYGALVPAGRRLQMVVAPAASAAIADFLTGDVVPGLRKQGVPVTVETVHPLPDSDTRGLVGFYTVVGWAIAGYLGATLFGLVFGTSPGVSRVAWRFAALATLGLLVGLGGAGIATGLAGYDHGFIEIALIGFLTVMATGTITVALQQFLGILGTGVAILVFVVFGNPAAGGAYATELLPGIWRTLGPLTPAGAATSAVRDAAYFPDASLWPTLLVLLAWIAVGVVAALIAGRKGPGISEEAEKASLAGVA